MRERRKPWHWLILAILSLIWGTSYILMKKGLESFSVYQVASLRILITALALLPVAIRSFKKLNKNNFTSVLIIGMCGSAIPAFLFPLAQTKIDSSLAGMLNSLSPVFTLIIGIMFYNRRLIRSQATGVFLGLLGAAGLLYGDSLTISYFGLFIVLATILNGISNNEAGTVNDLNGLQLTSLAFLLISPLAVIVFFMTDINAAVTTSHWVRNLGYIAILALFGSAIALALFYKLLKDTSPVFAAMTSYFIPVIATLWGIADGERFTTLIPISMVLIFSGVYLINRPGLLRNIGKIMK